MSTRKIEAGTGSVAERLQEVLLDFRRRFPHVGGSAIADRSGLPIASDLPPRINVLMVAAMGTLAMQSCSNVATNLGLEPADRILAESRDSLVLAKPFAGGTASLFAMMTTDVDRELAAEEFDRAARDAERVLGMQRRSH